MSICAGTPITAPRGYKSLRSDVTYYFLRSSPRTKLVTLVEFMCRPPKQVIYKKAKKPKRTVAQLPLAVLVRLPRTDWESGLWAQAVAPGERKLMPPWLEDLEGLDLALFDSERKKAAKPHQDRIDSQLFTFHALLPKIEEILDEDDPETLINRHARGLKPVQNVTRVRLWLFVYLAFGRNRNALHYPVHRLGRWDRMNHPSEVKRGAPGANGPGHGHNTKSEMLERIKSSYVRFSGIGVSDEKIYVDAMREEFGCKTRWVIREGLKELAFYHPHGEAFPEKSTYFYHVNKYFRPHLVQETRLGRNRARSKIKPFRGSFTESAWNLMQRVEADAYRVYDLPKGYIEGSDLPALVVVVKRDTASGKKTGIGFSQGSETAAAYRMASFCEAIGLQEFGRLLGMKVKDDGRGLSPYDITDRGPGSTAGGASRSPEFKPVIREGTQAYSGQAKALVETSNPKTMSDDEAPSYRRSNMTVVELARRELANLLVFNEATNVANRVDPELEHRVTRLSPSGIWEALDSVGRNDAVQIGFDEAIRAFLDIEQAVLKRGGLEVAGRNYFSNAEAFQEALTSAANGQDINVKVYVLTCCVRHVWFEWKGRLIELDVRYPVAVSAMVQHMSLFEAVEYHEHMKKREGAHAKHQRAAKAHFAQDFEEQTGMKLSSGTRAAGRPKRGGATARQEAKEAKQSSAGRKAA